MLRMPIVAATLGLASGQAAAQNWIGLLKNMPAERFDEEDLRLFDHAPKALNEAPDNQPMSWENPKTRHRGEQGRRQAAPAQRLSAQEEIAGP